MLIRLVRMTFRTDAVDRFLELFDKSSPRIRDFDGCHRLELWKDVDRPNVLTTYSEWTSEDALNVYRKSELFLETWQAAKALFDDAPVAQSHSLIRSTSAEDSA